MPAERRASPRQPLRRLGPFLTPYKWQIATALFFMFVAAAATLYLPVSIRNVIDKGFQDGTADQIERHFLFLFLVAMVMGSAAALRFYWVSWIGERVTADLRAAVFEHIIWLSPAFYERTRTGEVLSRLNTDTTLIQTVVGSSASVALRSTVMLVGAVVLLFLTSPSLAGMMIVALPLVLVPILVFGRKVRSLSRESQDCVADFSAVAGERIGAIATVQAFTAEVREQAHFSDLVERAFRTARTRNRYGALLTVGIVLLVFGAIAYTLYLGALRVLSGDMTPGSLSQFMLYAVIAGSATAALSEVWGDVQRAAGATERLVELLGTKPQVSSPSSPAPMPDPPKGQLRFDAVSFAYPTRPADPVFSDLSFQVKSGETVALVGPSGAGKSTILSLLLRFHDVTTGAITVDGVDLRQADLATLRQRFGLVAQDSVIFSATALENIRYGRPDASDDDVYAAATAAHAHDFLSALPHGYQSHLGERGVRLSGGQRQRLAIARALLRDPPVLLLDEATSALDAHSEKVVQRALDRLMTDRTTLVVAHRLATVRNADTILVLDNGRIVAKGNHEELLASGGLYADLAALQFTSNRAN
ncbi:MAG: ABC transporter transmembrane domain-containing protein [Pseudomonadota bacterium]